MDISDEMERVKLKFISAYRRLCDSGQVTEDQFEEVLEILDRIDEYSVEEVSLRLKELWPSKKG